MILFSCTEEIFLKTKFVELEKYLERLKNSFLNYIDKATNIKKFI